MTISPPKTSTGSTGSSYDIAVIGAGPGGYVAAIRAAQMGARVLVIEKDELGGTCLNWGCIPTKAFLSDVKPLRRIKISSVYEGKEGLSLNLKKMVNRKNEVVSTMVDGIAILFKSNHIHRVRGVASFLDSKTIGVAQDGKQETYTAKGIIIATGSTAGTIPALNIDGRKVLSTNDILTIPKIPRDLVIIGGGAIGIQFATIFNALGTEVTVVEMLPKILATEDDEVIRRLQREDDEVIRRLQRVLEGDGITILTDVEVPGGRPKGNKVEIEFQEKSGGKSQLRVEKVLIATARTPCTEGLGLETIGCRMEGKRQNGNQCGWGVCRWRRNREDDVRPCGLGRGGYCCGEHHGKIARNRLPQNPDLCLHAS